MKYSYIVLFFAMLSVLSLGFGLYKLLPTISNPLCGNGTFSHAGTCYMMGLHEYLSFALLLISGFCIIMTIILLIKRGKWQDE